VSHRQTLAVSHRQGYKTRLEHAIGLIFFWEVNHVNSRRQVYFELFKKLLKALEKIKKLQKPTFFR
jgi:hypothetical protein